MKLANAFASTLLSAALVCGCSQTAAPETGPINNALVATTPTQTSLSMMIDGQPWIADHDVFGAFHPAGYNRALLIAGGRGAKDAAEQIFNLNLFGIDGPGHYTVHSGNAEGSVAQLANWSTEQFLSGSMMGFDL